MAFFFKFRGLWKRNGVNLSATVGMVVEDGVEVVLVTDWMA